MEFYCNQSRHYFHGKITLLLECGLTLQVPAKVLYKVWSYNIYYMTLSSDLGMSYDKGLLIDLDIKGVKSLSTIFQSCRDRGREKRKMG